MIAIAGVAFGLGRFTSGNGFSGGGGTSIKVGGSNYADMGFGVVAGFVPNDNFHILTKQHEAPEQAVS